MNLEDLFKPIKKLQWKLTLSYTSVTVGSLVVVVIILAYLLFSTVLVPNHILDTALSPKAWINVMSNTTSEKWQHILSQDPIDTELVSLILKDGDMQVSFFDILQVGDLQVRARTLGEASVLIIMPNGVVIGSSNPDFVSEDLVGQPLDYNLLPGLEAVMGAAYAGEMDPERLFVTLTPYERFYFAIPYFSESTQEVLAVSLVYFSDLPTENDLPANITTTLGKSVVLLLLAAGIIGTIFGSLTARGMVNRLRRVSDVAAAWSRGDFSTFIQDPLADEISQLAQKLNHMARQLEELLEKRQDLAVSEERNRLARELHDSAKQEALAASFQLGTALTLFDQDPQAARTHLIKAEGLVDSVRKELTDLIHQLRPNDSGISFQDTLNDYLIDWSLQNDIGVELLVEGSGDLSLEVKQTIYRIMQEALANVARHSQAEGVQVSLRFRERQVEFCVEDDGVGFDPQLPREGIGLKSMKERAAVLDGEIRIESAPEKGVLICVVLPTKTRRGENA